MSELEIIQRPKANSELPIFSQINSLLARIYAGRGVNDINDLGRNLNQLLPDTGLMGIEAAVQRLQQALERQESILIIGDYDCDGATSTALAIQGLQMVGARNVSYLVPNRFEYGYGFSTSIVEQALKQSPDLFITVDNGIASIEGVERANQAGIDVIITDHHLPADTLPPACAIVNPNQKGCQFEAKSTCGAGVVFYLMIALRRHLQQTGWFEQQGIAIPNLALLLDLVALGTVADVVPLERNNRILVYQGLQRIRAGQCRPGIHALIEQAGKQQQKLTASDMSYALAPRLNAAGRLDDISIGIECLLANNTEEAIALAAMLNDLNQTRKVIEQEMQQQALSLLSEIELTATSQLSGVVLYNPEWHQGVIGILAGRIKEKLYLPVIVFAKDENDKLKGSARSIAGIHIRDILDKIATANPGLIQKFGGHAMAAGLSIKEQQLKLFKQIFANEVAQQLDSGNFKQQLLTDGSLTANEMTLEIAESLQYEGPWGHQFPPPCFDGIFDVVQLRKVGQRHLKMVLIEPDSGTSIDAIQFNADIELLDRDIKQVKIVYQLEVNEYRGQKSLQLRVEQLFPVV